MSSPESDADRFSLLLLADGEVLLDDVAVEYVFLAASEDTVQKEDSSLTGTRNSGFDNEPQAHAIHSRFLSSAPGTRRYGRLRIGSRSMFFDADDWRWPVVRIPAIAISSATAGHPPDGSPDSLPASMSSLNLGSGIAVPVVETGKRVGVKIILSRRNSYNDGFVSPSDFHTSSREFRDSSSDTDDGIFGGWSSPSLSSKLKNSAWFAVTAHGISLLREHGVDHPYVEIERWGTHWFRPLYAHVQAILDLVLWLQRVNGLSLRSNRQKAVRAAVRAREDRIHFDVSYLDHDISESTLLDEPCDTITALARSPGRARITTHCLYVMPIHGRAGGVVLRLPFTTFISIRRLRYGIRDCALEIEYKPTAPGRKFQEHYKEQGCTHMLAFRSNEVRELAYQSLRARVPSEMLQTFERRDLELATNRWRTADLSNFEYIMYLNLAAGRSFNDLSQYPVFPWVIADYEAPVLDLNNSATFRDLSRPIGALNQARLAVLEERFNEMPPPRFYYGTHYSTPAYVINYLVRAAPAAMLRLQNGRFDSPDRIFNSIKETWLGVLTNQTDLKELIPEFFAVKADEVSSGILHAHSATGEFLDNVLGLDLGVRQDGKRVDAVELPLWANGKSETFVAKNREALESLYVSRRIHKWIDLIFGCSARSPEAKNVFYTDVAELGIQDIRFQNAGVDEDTIEQLETVFLEFGRTPEQLFHHPHPRRFRDQIAVANVNRCDDKMHVSEDLTEHAASKGGQQKPNENMQRARDCGLAPNCTVRAEQSNMRGGLFSDIRNSGACSRENSPWPGLIEIEMSCRTFPAAEVTNLSQNDISVLDFDVFEPCDIVGADEPVSHFGIVIVSALGVLQVFVDGNLRRSKSIDHLSSVACFTDGTVFLGTAIGEIYSYSISSGRCEVVAPCAHGSEIVALKCCAESMTIASASLDATIIIWSVVPSSSTCTTLSQLAELDAEDKILEIITSCSATYFYLAARLEGERVLAWQIPIACRDAKSFSDYVDPVMDLSVREQSNATRSLTLDTRSRSAGLQAKKGQQICWTGRKAAEPYVVVAQFVHGNEFVARIWKLKQSKQQAGQVVIANTSSVCVASGISADTFLVCGDNFVCEYDCTSLPIRKFVLRGAFCSPRAIFPLPRRTSFLICTEQATTSLWEPLVISD